MTQRRPSVSANAVGASRHMRNPDCNQLLGPGRQRPIGEDLPAERLEALMTTSETPFGTLRHLKPTAQLSLTHPFWERPSVPLDHDPPAWLRFE